MKIPKSAESVRLKQIIEDFNKAARRYSSEYGIFIRVCGDYPHHDKNVAEMTRIFSK